MLGYQIIRGGQRFDRILFPNIWLFVCDDAFAIDADHGPVILPCYRLQSGKTPKCIAVLKNDRPPFTGLCLYQHALVQARAQISVISNDDLLLIRAMNIFRSQRDLKSVTADIRAVQIVVAINLVDVGAFETWMDIAGEN